MALIVIPNTFSAGAVIIASQHNANFSTIASDYNGNIDNNNISASAGIVYSKLNLTNSIVNADLNTSLALPDSKLAQITTASKVSGTALTSLSSIPSGAGIIPIVNLASGTATGSKFIRDDGTLQTVTDVTSNCLFQYSAVVPGDITLGTGIGEVTGSSANPTTGGVYRFLQYRKNGTGIAGVVWKTKWKKIAGVSTITFYAQAWSDDSANGTKAQVKVDVGGQNSTASGSVQQNTPEWVNASIDVSSLTNGTIYDVIVSVGHDGISSTFSNYLGNLMAFGS